jgi:hypothetical protein
MKTAEQIQKRLCKDSCDIGIEEIKQIQLDAYKAGLRDAADKAKTLILNVNPKVQGYVRMARDVSEAILTDANNRTNLS